VFAPTLSRFSACPFGSVRRRELSGSRLGNAGFGGAPVSVSRVRGRFWIVDCWPAVVPSWIVALGGGTGLAWGRARSNTVC
jgi:hypothetical protein